MNTYFALTIGPIYKTLSQAQRTREFWGGSYMFSWIMREIIRGMIIQNVFTPDDILMPYRKKHKNEKVGTGLYHDHMIAKISTGKNEQVLADFKKVTNDVLGIIAEHSKIELLVLRSYVRLNAVIFDLEQGQNIVETVTNYLDSLELQNPIFHNSWQLDWSDAIDNLNGRLFYKDAFTKGDHPDFVFDSIPEISSRGLRKANDKEYDQLVKTYITDQFLNKKRLPKNIESEIQDNFITQLSRSDLLKDAFRNYHKYIAIVHADGDNFGKTITTIGNLSNDVKNLSSLLFGFATDAANEIKDYGGTNVYAGGDDLLFFAPVATINAKGEQTIFDLINTLDTHFKATVSDKLIKISEADRPTLSWGVSISYYKFPLSEAIVTSRQLLFDKAKSYEGKNAVAFQVTKHSGQSFGVTFGKGKTDYKVHFKKMLEKAFDPDADFISSLQYQISGNETLLREIFNDNDYPKKVENFFDNFFDEEIHSSKKDFVHSVRDMLIQAFNDTALSSKVAKKKAHEERVKTAIDKTYSALRFIHFLNSKSDE